MVKKKDLTRLRYWCGMLLDQWEGGNQSKTEVEDTIELNNISAYKQLVKILRDDGNEKYAKELEKLIKEVEENE